MRVVRFIAAAVACLTLGVAAPAVASSVHSHRAHPALDGVPIDTPGILADVQCQSGAMYVRVLTVNTAGSTVSGDLKVVVDGSNWYHNTWGAGAGTVTAVSGEIVAGSYSTAYAEYTPSGSTWKVKKVRVDFPDSKNCT